MDESEEEKLIGKESLEKGREGFGLVIPVGVGPIPRPC